MAIDLDVLKRFSTRSLRFAAQSLEEVAIGLARHPLENMATQMVHVAFSSGGFKIRSLSGRTENVRASCDFPEIQNTHFVRGDIVTVQGQNSVDCFIVRPNEKLGVMAGTQGGVHLILNGETPQDGRLNIMERSDAANKNMATLLTSSMAHLASIEFEANPGVSAVVLECNNVGAWVDRSCEGEQVFTLEKRPVSEVNQIEVPHFSTSATVLRDLSGEFNFVIPRPSFKARLSPGATRSNLNISIARDGK